MTADQIRALRARLGLAQAEFAGCYGVPVKSLRAWERRGVATGAAHTLLRLIGASPGAVAAILAGAPATLPSPPMPPRRRGQPKRAAIPVSTVPIDFFTERRTRPL